MADTVTANYHWVKPQVGGDTATWGAKLNTDLDAIDNQVFTNATAAVAVGSILMWMMPTPPANYLWCDGSTYNVSDMPALGALFGPTFGGDGVTTFAVPELIGVFPIGYDPNGSSDGSAYYPMGEAFPVKFTTGEDALSMIVGYIVRYQ